MYLSIGINAQNGVYRSTKFQFISKNESFRNRIEYKNNTLTIQINEFQGDFLNGKILWELRSEPDDGQSQILEMSLKSIKNSNYDESNKAFIKIYYAEIKLLGQVVDQIEVFIWKFVDTNTYRVDMYDPVKKTINRFDNMVKL